MKINVTDQSNDYSMHLRFTVQNNVVVRYWFDIVNNTELNF